MPPEEAQATNQVLGGLGSMVLFVLCLSFQFDRLYSLLEMLDFIAVFVCWDTVSTRLQQKHLELRVLYAYFLEVGLPKISWKSHE